MSSNSTNNFHFSPSAFAAGLSAGSGSSLGATVLAAMSAGYLSKKLKAHKNKPSLPPINPPTQPNPLSPFNRVYANRNSPQNDVFIRG